MRNNERLFSELSEGDMFEYCNLHWDKINDVEAVIHDEPEFPAVKFHPRSMVEKV